MAFLAESLVIGFGHHDSADFRNVFSEFGNVLLRCHVIDDVREHVGKFFEGNFLNHAVQFSTWAFLNTCWVLVVSTSFRPSTDFACFW